MHHHYEIYSIYLKSLCRSVTSGWSACPFHAAALKCLQQFKDIQLEVKEFPEMEAFRGWLATEGYSSQSSPLCFADGEPLGGYGELTLGPRARKVIRSHGD